jgi:hypothetical protein
MNNMDVLKISDETRWIHDIEPEYQELWTKHTGNQALIYNGYDEIGRIKNVQAVLWDTKLLDIKQKSDNINGYTFTEYKVKAIESLEVGFDIIVIRLKKGE